MARRGEPEEDDSLELFLSTSCDSFGGIVFIMLLICLLPTKTMDAVFKDRDAAKTKLAQMQYDMRDADPSAAVQLSSKEEDLFNKAFADQSANLQAEVAMADSQVTRLKQMRDALKREIDDTNKRGSQMRLTRLPFLHTVNKQSFPLVLFHNRVYLPQVGKDFMLNSEDFDIKKLSTQVEFTPRPDKGMDAATWLRSKDGAATVQSYLPTDQILVNILLFPDSIQSFEAVRGAFTARGYDYNWIPLPPDQPLRMGAGTGKSNAQ